MHPPSQISGYATGTNINKYVGKVAPAILGNKTHTRGKAGDAQLVR